MDRSHSRLDEPIGSVGLPDILLGPGGGFCIDYADPERLLGVSTLPSGLKTILIEYTAEKADSDDWDSELDARSTGYNDSDTDNDDDDRRSRSRGGGRDRISESEVKAEVDPTSMHRHRSPDAENKAEDSPIVIHRDFRAAATADSRFPEPPPLRDPRRYDAYLRKQPPKISCLAFGSRIQDYAMIVCARGKYHLEGNVFDRLSSLRQWLCPTLRQDQAVKHTELDRDGSNVRLFLGAESAYFICDVQSRDFKTNVEEREFVDWLVKARNVLNSSFTLKRGYVPHSLAFGPDDMFCLIAEKDYKTNTAFRNMFPAIERYLVLAKAKKMLARVSFTCSPDLQPGSSLPYYVLSTTDGICISSVPTDAAPLLTRYATRWGVLAAARHARELRAASVDAKVWSEQVSDLTTTINESYTLIEAGSPGNPYLVSDKALSIISGLKRINQDCESLALTSEEWNKASLADRVHILLNNPTSSNEPISDSQAQTNQQTLTKLSNSIAIASQTLAAGSKGAESSTGRSTEPTLLGQMKYINAELNQISNVLTPGHNADYTHYPEPVEDLSLSKLVYAIISTQPPSSLLVQLDTCLKLCALPTQPGITPNWGYTERFASLIKELNDTRAALDGIASSEGMKWRDTSLADQVTSLAKSKDDMENFKASLMKGVKMILERSESEWEVLPSGAKKALEGFLQHVLAKITREDLAELGLTRAQLDEIRDAARGPI